MRTKPLLVLSLLACFGAGSASAQKAKDATEVDPDGHRVVFENAYVRVIDAFLPPGYKTPLHSHPARRVSVIVSGGRLKFKFPDGHTQVVDRRVGEASWSAEGVEHEAEVLIGPLRGIEIELKGPRPPAVARKLPDETEVTPDLARVVFENDLVRIVEARATAGTKWPLHSHPPRVNVFLSPIRIKVPYPDGKTEVVDRRAGEARWSDATEDAVELLAGTLHVISVEIKEEKPAAPR